MNRPSNYLGRPAPIRAPVQHDGTEQAKLDFARQAWEERCNIARERGRPAPPMPLELAEPAALPKPLPAAVAPVQVEVSEHAPTCLDCGVKITKDSKRCKACSVRHRRGKPETKRDWKCLDCGKDVAPRASRCQVCNGRFRMSSNAKRKLEQLSKSKNALKNADLKIEREAFKLIASMGATEEGPS